MVERGLRGGRLGHGMNNLPFLKPSARSHQSKHIWAIQQSKQRERRQLEEEGGHLSDKSIFNKTIIEL